MDVNWGGPGYPEYAGYLKVSGAEKQAAATQQQVTQSLQSDSQTLWSMMQNQFAEQQGLLNNVLIPQLQQMATAPQGFGVQALAAMKSQALDTIGGQLASQEAQLRQNFASQNMAGLQSGVEQATAAQLGQAATGQEASTLNQIAIANAQAQMQQQEFGLSGLSGAVNQLGQVPQSAQLALSGLNAAGNQAMNQFNAAYTMAKQGGFWSNLAQGVLGSLGGIGGALTGLPGIAGTIGNVIGGFTGNYGTATTQQIPSVTAGSELLGLGTPSLTGPGYTYGLGG